MKDKIKAKIKSLWDYYLLEFSTDTEEAEWLKESFNELATLAFKAGEKSMKEKLENEELRRCDHCGKVKPSKGFICSVCENCI